MPVRELISGESPDNITPIHSSLNVSVAREVTILVVADEFMILHPQVDDQGDSNQDERNQPFFVAEPVKN